VPRQKSAISSCPVGSGTILITTHPMGSLPIATGHFFILIRVSNSNFNDTANNATTFNWLRYNQSCIAIPWVDLNDCRTLFGVVRPHSLGAKISLSNTDGPSGRRAVQDNACVLWSD